MDGCRHEVPFSTSTASLPTIMKTIIAALQLLQLLYFAGLVQGWVLSPASRGASSQRRTSSSSSALIARSLSQDPQQQSSTAVANGEEDEDLPAGIEGAQFFGGNKQKEEFYDPVAEALAGEDLELSQSFCRWSSDDVALAQSLQKQINEILYGEKASSSEAFTYASNVEWQTPLAVSSTSPLQELKQARDFYNKLDAAILSGRQVKSDASLDIFELSWEISVEWPTLWAPRVLLAGQSLLTVNRESKQIVRQVDTLSGRDDNVMNTIVDQLKPRFWDLYHIGMTPSAELTPRTIHKQTLSYQILDLPSRLYLQPILIDTGSREDANAGMIPNSAFTTVIKTMGPQKQEYTTASPVEVQITPRDGRLQIQWLIPLSVEFVARNDELPVPEPDEEDQDIVISSSYVKKDKRRVAVVSFGGSPQDPEITVVRKKLYEQVIRDGFKPKLDENGRPIFFYWQNNVKACYTQDGLGMAVYEWRPNFVQSDQVGMELEL